MDTFCTKGLSQCPSSSLLESGSTKPQLLRSSHSTVITQSRAICCMHVWNIWLATQHGEADNRGVYKRRARPNNSFLTVKHSTERLIKWVWVQWSLSWNELALRSCCRVSGVQPKGEHKTQSPLSPAWGGHRKGIQMEPDSGYLGLARALLEKSAVEMNDRRHTIKFLNSEIWHVSHHFKKYFPLKSALAVC